MTVTDTTRDAPAADDQEPGEPPQVSLHHAIEAARGGHFSKAARMLADLGRAGHGLPRLFEAITLYVADKKDAHREIRAALDALAAAQDAEVVFTTLPPQKPVGTHEVLAAPYEISGNGRSVVTNRYLYLETLPEQRAVMKLRQPLPADRCLFVHVLTTFMSNIQDNFYLVLRGPEHEETVRFSNNGVTLCNDGCTAFYTPRTPTFVSIALSTRHVSLYLNGNLHARRRRERRPSVDTLQLELRGSISADLGAQVLGLEVWASDQPLESFGPPHEDLFETLVEERLEAMNGQALYEIFELVDDVPVRDLEARLLPLLDRLVTATPYREEVMRTLLRQLPLASAERWLAQHRASLPAPIIAVEDVTVQFSREPHRLFALGRILRGRDAQMFNVLQDIGFNLYPGDILGIIGENGAGKSTLLRTIASLIPLKQGQIFVGGRHVLLRAGVGFRDEATGRENIFLAGSYLQLNAKQIRGLVDEIIAFAELEDAIDKPFKYYSDGMKARLIFSLATCITPEILMLDEPLGAGDARFRDKAARRMDELIGRAKAVIIVTHGTDFVRKHCTKALYLVKGRQVFFGDPDVAVNHYLNDLHLSGTGADA